MKNKNQLSPLTKATPDGEGFIALPIAFNMALAGFTGTSGIRDWRTT
jgi:hypothetical protein